MKNKYNYEVMFDDKSIDGVYKSGLLCNQGKK